MKKLILFIKDNFEKILLVIVILTLFIKEVRKMLEFIRNNPVLCIVICIIIIAIVVYLIRYKGDVLQKAALYAVSRAEAMWGSSTGQIKFAEAYTYIKKKYPFITFFVTEAQLSNLIEKALATLKEIIAAKESVIKKEEEKIATAPDLPATDE